MYEIPSQIYEKTAQKLCDSLGNSSYFSGTIDFTFESVECCLKASLIIYHKRIDAPDGCTELIDEIVPVWWEFHTIIDSEERINDFDFSLLKEYIIQ